MAEVLKTITWTNTNLSSVAFWGIRLRAIQQEVLKNSMYTT